MSRYNLKKKVKIKNKHLDKLTKTEAAQQIAKQNTNKISNRSYLYEDF